MKSKTIEDGEEVMNIKLFYQNAIPKIMPKKLSKSFKDVQIYVWGVCGCVTLCACKAMGLPRFRNYLRLCFRWNLIMTRRSNFLVTR